MNVPFNKISSKDAATMIGVHYSSITSWCANGLIPYTDVSGGTGKKRIMLDEADVMLLKSARKKWGNQMLKHVSMVNGVLVRDDETPKPVAKVKPVATFNPIKAEEKPVDETELFAKEAQEWEKARPQRFDDSKLPSRKVDIDEIAIIVGDIQDIKDRLEDLEAEKNQLLAELEMKKKIVMDAIQ